MNRVSTSHNEIKALLAQKELFIFDLDGTLFNTLGDLAPAVNYALLQFGLQTHTNGEIMTFIGNGSINLIKRAVAANFKRASFNIRDIDAVTAVLNRESYSEDKVKKIHEVYSNYYWEHCTENTVPYDGVEPLIHRITSRNKCIADSAVTRYAAMLTNKPEAPAKKILEKFNLLDDFATILCGDTTPERKPSPAGIFEILHKTGVKPEKAIMIGDDTPDVMAAKNAGLDCITLMEGFGKPENLLPLEPKYTARHIKDFATFI